MKKVIDYIKDSAHELKLVTWPKQDDLLRHTIITVVAVLISALILGLLDFGLNQAYQWFLTLAS